MAFDPTDHVSMHRRRVKLVLAVVQLIQQTLSNRLLQSTLLAAHDFGGRWLDLCMESVLAERPEVDREHDLHY